MVVQDQPGQVVTAVEHLVQVQYLGVRLEYHLEALEVMRVPVLPQVLRARMSYQSALESGRSAEESDPASEAAQEIAGLWTFLEGFVFGRPAGAAPAELGI